MGTVGVRRCSACNALTAEWGECRKCGAVPGETAEARDARMNEAAPLPDKVAGEFDALTCGENDKAAIRAFARRPIKDGRTWIDPSERCAHFLCLHPFCAQTGAEDCIFAPEVAPEANSHVRTCPECGQSPCRQVQVALYEPGGACIGVEWMDCEEYKDFQAERDAD